MRSQFVASTQIENKLAIATQRILQNIDQFGESFPYEGDGQVYDLKENDNWTAGFWPGLLWLAYSFSGLEKIRDFAESLLPSFARRLDSNIQINHDLGFLYTLSAKAKWQFTKDEGCQSRRGGHIL